MIVKGVGGGTYTPHPEGQFGAVCVDVVDMGIMEGQFGPKHKMRLVFWCGESEERDGDRIPLTVSEMFTVSLHEKSNLRAFVKSWRGKDFSEEELRGFDFERMIGAPAFVDVQHHNTNSQKTYANIVSIMRLPSGMQAMSSPSEYIRVKDREPRVTEKEDDGLPF